MWPLLSSHRLLKRFKALTGCPVVVNTSFNVRGEPTVCTPQDAFHCFMASFVRLRLRKKQIPAIQARRRSRLCQTRWKCRRR